STSDVFQRVRGRGVRTGVLIAGDSRHELTEKCVLPDRGRPGQVLSMRHRTAFVTGATGYIGRSAVAAFLERGWGVTALSRRTDHELPPSVRPWIADFTEVERWAPLARRADVIVNLAFPAHGDGWASAVALERDVLDALADHLRDYPGRLILTNGTAFLGDSGDGRLGPEARVDKAHPAAIRAATTSPSRWSDLDVVELRFASFVYGRNGSVFLPALLDHARSTGESIQVDAGSAVASTVDVDAAGRACVAAAEQEGPCRATHHIAGDEEPTTGQIARAVAIATGSQVVSVSVEEAARRLDPFTAMFLAQNNRLDIRTARAELGWSGATSTPLLWDVAFGSYAPP
ncbi:MAG: NAD-dependent epimerase/dehydratase family protein, partial [Myxococcota bacterium]